MNIDRIEFQADQDELNTELSTKSVCFLCLYYAKKGERALQEKDSSLAEFYFREHYRFFLLAEERMEKAREV